MSTHIRAARLAGLAWVAVTAAAGLAGCGLAETGVSAATAAKADADAAQEGLRTEARVREQIEQAQQAAAAQRQAVDE